MNTTEYIILELGNYTDSELSDIDKCCVTHLTYARKNADNTKCIMKVSTDSAGVYPTTINSFTKYSLSEITTITATTEWQQVAATEDLPEDWPGHTEEIE